MMTLSSRSVRTRVSVFLAACLCAANLSAATTTISQFTGGDPGEGLDLEGNFLYAVNIGSTTTSRRVGEVTFNAQGVSGVTIDARAMIETWGAASFGDTENDNNLEAIMNSIVHNLPAPIPPVNLTVTGLEPGADYKLQLLFGEACCQRAFDVTVDGELVADEFAPVVEQGGLPQGGVAVVITHEFTAESGTLLVVLDGATVTTPEFTDLNPILSAFTLERTSASGDSDADGLTDDWELRYFGNLDQDGTADGDEDGLTDAEEFAADSDPTNADTDADGLQDGAEVTTHNTDPTLNDTDGEGVWDGQEVNMAGTDPNDPDTDDDTYSDFDELRFLTLPTEADSKPKNTTVNVFTGPEPGAGLDLQGIFLGAINAGPDVGDLGFIGEAYFTVPNLFGVELVAGNQAAGWHDPSFGDTIEDDLLEIMMSSIAWSAAGAPISDVQLKFTGLEFGGAYKAQLLFAEHGWPRGFDVRVDGALVVDDFSPQHYQGGYPKDKGVVLTHSFIARSTEVTISLDGRGVTLPQYTDHNAILQGATLEVVAPYADTDADGLPDPWEMDVFGDLSQSGSDDTDEDGLSNQIEFDEVLDPVRADTDRDGLEDGAERDTHGTNPLQGDSDNDGLLDGEEVNVTETDPNLADSDGDRLNDAVEVNTTLTDPNLADTDGDGTNDHDELRLLSDPLDENSVPATRTEISIFTGGDAGEGLDLEGDFAYAIDIGASFPLGLVGEANFTDALFAGFTFTAGVTNAAWHMPEYGESINDELLELLMASISYSVIGQTPDSVQMTFDNLQPGNDYKVQLLFAEACCPRGFDVLVDGELVVDEFSPMVYQGGFAPEIGVVLTHEFTAQGTSATVVLQGSTVTTPQITDRNAIIQGVTVENLGQGAVELRILGLERTAGEFTITVESVAGSTYQLEYRADLSTGTWEPAGNPVTATGASTVLVDGDEGHTGGAQGFWRVRQE